MATTSATPPSCGEHGMPHIAIIPFLSKGHTIPLIELAILIHSRSLATLTFVTTPANATFLRTSLKAGAASASIIELPFPPHPDIPDGVESTDKLPSFELFLPFIHSISLLRPAVTDALRGLNPPPTFLISDGFLSWTKDVAGELGIPRVVSYGMNAYSRTVYGLICKYKPHAGVTSVDQPFNVPGFPGLELTKADLNPPFDDPEPSGPMWDYIIETGRADFGSHGLVLNTFRELESAYLDRLNLEFKPKAWCLGPLCLARESVPKPEMSGPVANWLDSRLVMNRPVLYIAFGSQVQLPPEQLKELAIGLDRSGLDFLWLVRATETELGDGFEERVGERGRVVREWVDQTQVLKHEAVKGFISHCGWNSVTESMCGAVPILAWPVMAEQWVNAKFVVDELKMGLRIRASGGTAKDTGLVVAEDVERMAKELMVCEAGKRAAARAEELAEAAKTAMDVGGSSYVALQEMIEEVCARGND